MGRFFGIIAETGGDLPEGHDRRQSKYRIVFQGNRVVDQNWEAAFFQDLGRSPTGMEASKAIYAFGCYPGRGIQQTLATQTYVRAAPEGKEPWVHLPGEAAKDPR